MFCFPLVTTCSDNHSNSLLSGDKRPYLSLPRPGVSIAPSILMNIPGIQWFVILWLMPLSFPTEALTHQLEDCQGCQVGCRGSVRHKVLWLSAQYITSHLAPHSDSSIFISRKCCVTRVQNLWRSYGNRLQFWQLAVCHMPCRPATGSRIMLIVELLSVLTNENNLVFKCTFLKLHSLYFRLFP